MSRARSHPVRARPAPAGFTLIELLVVIAVISVLLALMLPVLHRVRTSAYRVACGSRLKQIAAAWHTYLGDHNQQFLQEVDANHNFGGWKGIANGALRRPLNPYAGLPAEVLTREGAGLFRCPADQGDEGYGPSAYLHFGNSYQTNLMLIGQDSLPARRGLRAPLRELNSRINEHLKNLRADMVSDWVRQLLVGDDNWVTQWDPINVGTGRTWHGGKGRYNLAFLDGHVALTEIRKGIYLDSGYRVQPFSELDDVTSELQSEIVRQTSPDPGP